MKYAHSQWDPLLSIWVGSLENPVSKLIN
jgi:hypothetical protein